MDAHIKEALKVVKELKNKAIINENNSVFLIVFEYPS